MADNILGWDDYFLKMTELVASKSKDTSTKCGCVIVNQDHAILTTGYNGLPRGCAESDFRNTRPQKYAYYEHAERNAIYNAARIGVSLLDSTAYVTGPPCCDCARGLIQSGVSLIVHKDIQMDPRWAESLERAREMIKEAHVILRLV
jgi:dCMP deaminase